MDISGILEKFADSFGIPVIYSVNHQIVRAFREKQDFARKVICWTAQGMEKEEAPLKVAVNDYGTYAANLTLSEHEHVGIGPGNGSMVPAESMHRFCRELHLGDGQREDFSRWLSDIPKMTMSSFAAAAELLYFMLTGENVTASFLEFHSHKEYSCRFSRLEEVSSQFDIGWREKIERYVERGEVEELRQMLGSWYMDKDEDFPLFAESRLQSMQMSLAALILYCGQAAVRGGVDQEVVNAQTIEDYTMMFSVSNVREYTEEFKRIARDYAAKVQALRGINRESAIVCKIDKVIQQHLQEKITPTSIAQELEMNVSYLCREFKRHTGKTIGEYINECKVQEAKRLLKKTDMPLVAVAEALSFSSQSYFHRVFKKVTGKTPVAFRNSG